ncbi:LAGLIDADG family homing endonuclease [Taklimakanibacter lacteus]|uniref:LAGLIDADG family homing endonuclease n=1 Tax=Taklimakanibacter lacteus TaxID=2268456 RepID=UPI000E6712CF
MPQAQPHYLDPISAEIWDMKYRFKKPDGSAVDESVEASWRRVAKAVAEAEKPAERTRWAAAFEGLLKDYRFLPAGRILSGAGTARTVTLFNCFVMGTIDDSLSGIFDALKEAALTMQQGGGVGMDFSTLRPKGAAVKGVGADASGPLSFMDVWDAMCRTIMSAGSRRGAMMGTLRCDHPDIEDFIAAKADPRRLRMFNLSVLVTDDFMTAVKEDKDWPLVFAGQTYRTIRARALWEQIMRSTYDYAEPGVIFIDRINRENNLAYCETIQATNPCLTADSWIMTTEGPRQIADLQCKPFTAIANGAPWPSDDRGFFSQGVKPVVKLQTREGFALSLTSNHLIMKAVAPGPALHAWQWVEASSLKTGDKIFLHDHRDAPDWGDVGEAQRDEAEGYLLGLLIGDGVLKDDKAVLSVWPGKEAVGGGFERPGVEGIMSAALAAAKLLPHRVDFTGWMAIEGRGEFRLSTSALKKLAHAHGLAVRSKNITPLMEKRSRAFHAGFLRGLFDTDGSVQGSQTKGVSIRLAQSDLPRLTAAQRMLARLGIMSVIYRDRRVAGIAVLPDGKGSSREYATRPQHELVIANENIALFAQRVGFADRDKRTRLKQLLQSYKRALNRESYVATIESLESHGEAEVFDAAIPGLNAFDANGLWAHNCGEQPLPPYGACLLGSVNLAALVIDPFTDEARLDAAELQRIVPLAVRFMDNVVDVSNYPLPEQRKEALSKRRIGLGLTGLADALAMCGLRYGSDEAARQAKAWMAEIERLAYLASSALAREKGAFPLYDRQAYLASGHVRGLDEDIRKAIGKDGIRNALLTSIAPTGTISLFAGNVSSGIEPIFSIAYERKVLQPNGERITQKVEDYAARLWRGLKGEDTPLPASFATTNDLNPHEHLVMQAAIQPHIDSSISKTINCPPDLSFEAFKAVYLEAYEQGLKGCTTFRPNEVTGSVLSLSEPAKAGPVQAALPLEAVRDPVLLRDQGEVIYMKQPLARHEVLPGFTYKLKWADSDHAIYITINDILQDGRRRPFEIFINSKNMEHFAWTVALTRMISAVFRRGGDVSFVVEELKAVFDPRGGQWMEGRYVPSLLAAIGGVIERHMIDTGFLKEDAKPGLALAVNDGTRAAQCPRCGEAALVFQEGCSTCLSCGYSKCS